MNTLSRKQCSEWLASHGITEDPYYLSECPSPFYDQVIPPAEPLRRSSLVRRLVEAAMPFNEALVEFTDWSIYYPDQMAIIAAIRTVQGGPPPPLIKSPGNLFDSGEKDLLIGVFSLALFYGWSAYLYFDHGTTNLCWEGDVLDLWAYDEPVFTSIQQVFRAHNVASPRTD